MGCTCSEAADESKIQTRQKHLNNMFDQCLRKGSCSPNIQPLFITLRESMMRYYWTNADLSELIQIVQYYISKTERNYHGNTKMKPTITLIEEQFNTDALYLQNKVQRRNNSFPTALMVYQTIKNTNLTFSVQTQQEKKQLRTLTDKISTISIEFPQGYIYFSLIFVKYCLGLEHLGLEQKNVNLHQINRKLENILQFLNKDLMDTPQTDVAEETMIFYQNFRAKEYNKLESKKYITADKIYQKVKIYHGQGIQNQKILEKEIYKLSWQAKDQQETFKKLVSKSCKNGKNLKINLKLSNSNEKLALQRIKQKILTKTNKPYKKENQLKFSTIQKLRQHQIQSKKQQFIDILNGTDQLLLCISDMLRGRCIFQTIQQINNAALGIIQSIKTMKQNHEDVDIVEVDNRLKALTNDVVLKIKIRKVVCQFQLSLATDNHQSFHNQIYHKVYEISRSKTMTSLSMLFDWHERLAQKFIKFSFNALNSKKIHLTTEQQNIYNQLMENLQVKDSLIEQYKFSNPPYSVQENETIWLKRENQQNQNVALDSIEATKSGSAEIRPNTVQSHKVRTNNRI